VVCEKSDESDDPPVEDSEKTADLPQVSPFKVALSEFAKWLSIFNYGPCICLAVNPIRRG
jgi:hypothetical protein